MEWDVWGFQTQLTLPMLHRLKMPLHVSFTVYLLLLFSICWSQEICLKMFWS